ncbi:hypothetical protein CMI47_03890 [Candidatus Pacearchaeota archaeon]|nr:hypothetical protein [Candidatus Pacearchaeota archaeon]|tara:strand:- start:269 stop:1096 length:828 start_codon:yes stop_codon:yes gene_type:complete
MFIRKEKIISEYNRKRIICYLKCDYCFKRLKRQGIKHSLVKHHYCTTKCAAQSRSRKNYNITCIICKKNFRGKMTRKTCSENCSNERRRNRQKLNRAKNMKTILCLYCNSKHKTYKLKNTKFCSRSCSAKWYIENTNKFDNWINSKSKYSRSKGENEIYKFLKEIFPKLNILTHNKAYTKVNNMSFKPDIKINNLIIEYFGDYWHMNPKIYSKNDFNKRKNMYAYEIWEYDANKVKLLDSTGYNTHIIWEHSYKTNKQKSLDKLVSFIKENISDK